MIRMTSVAWMTMEAGEGDHVIVKGKAGAEVMLPAGDLKAGDLFRTSGDWILAFSLLVRADDKVKWLVVPSGAV